MKDNESIDYNEQVVMLAGSDINAIIIGGLACVQVKHIPEYLSHYVGEFNVPSYRTIRHWATTGKIKRPLRFKKKSYYPLEYADNTIGSNCVYYEEDK